MIPKQAFFVYGEHDENPLVDLGQKNIADFKQLNPDWDVKFITLDNSPELYKRIFRWNKLAWSQVVRFDLIHKHGGLYSDVDIMFYGPVPDMEGCEAVIAVETHGTASDAFFAASPNHPVIGKMLSNAVAFCHQRMEGGEGYMTTSELFKGAGIHMFSDTVKKEFNMNLHFEKQIHMTQEEFGGKFNPENGVGILPFEAISRHNEKNWVGWHQCWGTWRPGYSEGKCDMGMEAKLKCITGNEYDAINWNSLASESPYFYVLTDPNYKEGLDESFWESGKHIASILTEYSSRVGVDLSQCSVTEIGVGVGRIARHMASLCQSYTGLDVSDVMVDVCLKHNPSLDVRVIDSDDLPESDVYYSHITLQHCTPQTIRKYIRGMMSSTKKLIWFQLYDPHGKGSVFCDLPMNGLPPTEILEIANEQGWKMRSVLSDGSVGEGHDSYQYLFTR